MGFQNFQISPIIKSRFSHYDLKRVARRNFPLAVALYMANTAMVFWITVLKVYVSKRHRLIYSSITGFPNDGWIQTTSRWHFGCIDKKPNQPVTYVTYFRENTQHQLQVTALGSVYWTMDTVLNSGHCTGQWTLYWTVETLVDSGHCTGQQKLYWTVNAVLDSGHCTGQRKLY